MQPLLPARRLLVESFALCVSARFRWMYLSLGTVPVGASILLSALISFLSLQGFDTTNQRAILIPGLLLIGVAAAVFSSWYMAILLHVNWRSLAGELLPLSLYVRLGWQSLGRFIITVFILAALTLLGFLLFVVPGVLFLVWFAFTPAIAVVEKKSINAFKESRSLVRGRFWPVAGRLLLFYLLSSGSGAILGRLHPLLSSLWAVTGPYFSLATISLYRDLKQSRHAPSIQET